MLAHLKIHFQKLRCSSRYFFSNRQGCSMRTLWLDVCFDFLKKRKNKTTTNINDRQHGPGSNNVSKKANPMGQSVIHYRQWCFLSQEEFWQIATVVKKGRRVVWNEKAQSVGGSEGRPTPTQAAASSYQLILTTGKSFPGYCAILNSDAIPELFGSTFQENFDHQLYFASRCNIRIGAVPCNSRTNTYFWRNIVLEQLQSKMTIFCPTVCRSNQCCLCMTKSWSRSHF